MGEIYWLDYSDKTIPEGISIEPQSSLVNLLRAIIYHVLQISTFSEASYKENYREAIIDFLNASL